MSELNLPSPLGERAYWVISSVPPYIKGAIIGLILSDAYLRLFKSCVNARLEFKQSTANSGCFWYVFCLLSPIIQAKPNYYTGILKGVPYYGIELWTPCLPILREYYDLW